MLTELLFECTVNSSEQLHTAWGFSVCWTQISETRWPLKRLTERHVIYEPACYFSSDLTHLVGCLEDDSSFIELLICQSCYSRCCNSLSSVSRTLDMRTGGAMDQTDDDMRLCLCTCPCDVINLTRLWCVFGHTSVCALYVLLNIQHSYCLKSCYWYTEKYFAL